MKIKFKKIFASVVAIATFVVVATGMTVSAATAFSFNLVSDSSDYITMVKQNNNINYVTVNITNGNLSSTHIAYVWIEDSSGNKITSIKQITRIGFYFFNFSTPISPGSSVRFYVSGGYNGVQISGTIEV